MPDICPEAQALIDRLAAMDPARPSNDKVAIERAVTAHLATLGLPDRPFIWVDDLHRARRQIVSERANDFDFSDPPWDAAWDDVWSDAWMEAEEAAYLQDAWENVAAVMWHGAIQDLWSSARFAVWKSVWSDDVSEWPWTDDRDAPWEASRVAIWAAVRYPGTAPQVTTWLPMLEAFEAGLFFFCITPRGVICVLQPVLSIENSRLHRADGPAVVWSTGEVYHFWRGVQVPAWIIEEPGKITVEAIREERNQEIRRCMVEIYGRSRYLRDSGAKFVDGDEFGRLWEVDGADGERWRFVEVENGTPEPDGSRRTYTLDVTGAERALGWPITTARAAVAATYGLRPEEYCPEVRT